MGGCFICCYLAGGDRHSRSVCRSCYEGVKLIIASLNEADDGAAGPRDYKSTNKNAKDLCNGLERMKERDKNLEEKVSFLDAVSVLREGILTDILVKPGKGQPIPAHRVLLAAKSEILRTMLLADDCKTAAEDTISLPKLSHDELKCLLHFLYTGILPAPPENDSTMSLYYSLFIASDMYDIPFLRKQCSRQILAALHTSNALNVLEAIQMFSDAETKQKIINLIIDHAEEVVFSAGYEEFARRNAHLSVEIMRELLTRKGQNDEIDDGAAGPLDYKSTNKNAKDLCNGLERMKERVSFLDAVSVLREGILADILVKPGTGQPIPAHRAMLAAKSEILRTMLLADDCKTAVEDTISLPEFSHDELKCLLDFLYTGTLPALPDNDSSFSLYNSSLIASDKYDIPFLRNPCCRQILAAVHTSNALSVLEATQMFSDAELKQKIINLIIDHAEEVLFSASYEEFTRRNAHLSVEIMRALLTREERNATSTTSCR